MPILESQATHGPIRRMLEAILPFLRRGSRAGRPSPAREVRGRSASSRVDPSVAVRRRLVEEEKCLQSLCAERLLKGNANLGRSVEDRIIWGELLELELQEVDEQVSRICDVARDAKTAHPALPDGLGSQCAQKRRLP